MPDLRKAAELADLEGMGASDCYLALGDALYRQNPASAEAVQALEKAWQKEQYTASADTKAKIIDKYPEAAAKIWPDENIPTAAQKALAKQEQEKKN